MVQVKILFNFFFVNKKAFICLFYAVVLFRQGRSSSVGKDGKPISETSLIQHHETEYVYAVRTFMCNNSSRQALVCMPHDVCILQG